MVHIARACAGTLKMVDLDIIVYLSVYHPYNYMYAGTLGQITIET